MKQNLEIIFKFSKINFKDSGNKMERRNKYKFKILIIEK